MKTLFRWLILLLSLSAIITGIVSLLGYLAPDPPVDTVNGARRALSGAAASRAESYADVLFSEAQAAYDSALSRWQGENRKFIFFRNYEDVALFASRAKRLAQQSASRSVSNTGLLREKLAEKIDSLLITKDNIEVLFGRYPFSPEIRMRIANGKMLLKEGSLAFSDSDYLKANLKIVDAGYLLTGVYNNTIRELEDYFRSYPAWAGLVQSAINVSAKSNSVVLIIDKMAKKCYVYSDGIKQREFDAELGRNWIGTKRVMGDKATPEGSYKIIRKLQGNETLYHRSLALDYPNIDDQAKFRNDMVKGLLPSTANIGGGIEIHGGGGRGADWTDGCIALTDKDIDVVFNMVSLGTPVTIVGSARPLNEVLGK